MALFPQHYPEKVTLIEVGPRDGFQLEKRLIPTELKAEVILGLLKAGFKHIQVTAFVHPLRVPQMGDAENLLKCLPRDPGVLYNALVLNTRGLERALATDIDSVEISVSASDTHSRKNTGLTQRGALDDAIGMIKTAREAGRHIRAGIQCVFGCVYEGRIAQIRILEMAQRFLDAGVDLMAIADTTGMGTPPMVLDLLGKLLPLTAGIPLVLHLHDTKGFGKDNLLAAMACGVTHFDTAFGGLGGCPFVPGASGNIGTEETVDMLHGMRIETGIDSALVRKQTKRILSFRR